MKKIAILFIVFLITVVQAYAADNEKQLDPKTTSQLDLSLPNDVVNPPSNKSFQQPEIDLTPKSQNDLGGYCKDMLRNIEQLKGKPVRRGALIQQYEAECLDRDSKF